MSDHKTKTDACGYRMGSSICAASEASHLHVSGSAIYDHTFSPGPKDDTLRDEIADMIREYPRVNKTPGEVADAVLVVMEKHKVETTCTECLELRRVCSQDDATCQDHTFISVRKYNMGASAVHLRIIKHFGCDAFTASYVYSGVMSG